MSRDAGWRLLRRRPFAVYWGCGLVSNTGTWLHNVTAGVLMLTLTGSPFLVGLASAATFLPALLFSLPAGALSDRVDRRAVVAVTQTVALLTGVALCVLASTGVVRPWSLLVCCFVIGSAYAVAKPALSAMLPELVPRGSLVEATAFNTLQFNLGQIAGPALSATILLGAGPAWAFGLNAVTFAVQITAMAFLPASAGGTGVPAGTAAEGGVRDGLRFVRRTPPMPSILLALVLCNAAVEALRTLAPSIAGGVLGVGESIAGVVVTAYSGGALAGLLAVAYVRRRLAPGALLAAAFCLQAAGAWGVSVASSVGVVVTAAVLVGVGFAFAVPLLNATLQLQAPAEFRGRVMSVFSMAHIGVRPVFSVGAGAAASLVGVRGAFVAFGLVAGVAAVATVAGRLGDLRGGSG